MKTTADYIVNVYGKKTFARAVELNDVESLMDLMDDFSDHNLKLFKNELKAFLKANRKLTPQQIIEHFKL